MDFDRQTVNFETQPPFSSLRIKHVETPTESRREKQALPFFLFSRPTGPQNGSVRRGCGRIIHRCPLPPLSEASLVANWFRSGPLHLRRGHCVMNQPTKSRCDGTCATRPETMVPPSFGVAFFPLLTLPVPLSQIGLAINRRASVLRSPRKNCQGKLWTIFHVTLLTCSSFVWSRINFCHFL